MAKRKIGERAECVRCGLEIEWVGYWHDRGGQRTCNYQEGPDGELVNIEAKALKHKPYVVRGGTEPCHKGSGPANSTP